MSNLLTSQGTAPANGLELYYETYGDPTHPPVLLVMGLGAQLIGWPIDLVHGLVERGHYVIRHDNRDVGLSTKTPGTPPSDGVAYTLGDMASDAVGVLDHLDIDAAHVVGASMGGMIVQHLGFSHGDRVRSITSIMSSTGNAKVGQATEAAMGALLTPPPTERDANIEHGIAVNQLISGPLWNADDARARTEAAYDRCFNPMGAAFQMAAILADRNRTERLAQITAPTLVIHGRADDLIHYSGGIATADAISGADLLLLAEMGHDLPRPLLPIISDAIADRVQRS